MSVSRPKGGNIVWTCVNNHIIDENEQYKAIGLRGFDYKLFEAEDDGGTKEVLDGYPYLKNIIHLSPGDWENQMEK